MDGLPDVCAGLADENAAIQLGVLGLRGVTPRSGDVADVGKTCEMDAATASGAPEAVITINLARTSGGNPADWIRALKGRFLSRHHCGPSTPTAAALGVVASWDLACVSTVDQTSAMVEALRGNVLGSVLFNSVKTPGKAEEAACFRLLETVFDALQWRKVRS